MIMSSPILDLGALEVLNWSYLAYKEILMENGIKVEGVKYDRRDKGN